ncbi:probable LRR receptor-like serine/threonine-protein kinase At1g53430 isoform X2 [Aristolochia californica]|uniref:probable LRR receptor-like serine/threonine-protein kinase At1g53430 isoform X2 n=1 Tax=Aristolochia californica TaxID=171875 RepID=UPI0035DD68E1
MARVRRSSFVLVFVVFLCVGLLRTEGQKLPVAEEAVLRAIGNKLGKRDWDFDINPCNGTAPWVTEKQGNYENNVTCDCSYEKSTVCHVIRVVLKGQNLNAVLPEEFANLTFLQQIDLTRNYLNGSIPSAWASLPLTFLSLLGNRISGTIPKELGNIDSLAELIIQDNSLRGPLPPELGKLVNLQRFLASGNYFTGPLPTTFGELKNLTDLIDGNNISGKIPSFIGNWINLDILDMLGTSMEGPIPSTISLLHNLTELRISDLHGSSNPFPPLKNLTKLKYLTLRNCSISDEIPPYIGTMSDLKSLDLSFNQLTGEIPGNFDDMGSIDNLYLTSNMLTGRIPDWFFRSGHDLDISYNNFTDPPSQTTCSQGKLNYIATFFSAQDSSIPTCMRRSLPCSGEARNYEIFINCGGPKLNIGDREYEADVQTRGPSVFYSTEKWGYSSTGDFITASNAPYTASNISTVTSSEMPALYETARLSPLSLKYYGFCLQEGNYTVGLHFAEIVFTDNETYSSVGRRLFDVSIQGQIMLNDFDIEKEAGGSGKGFVQNYTAMVSGPSHTLEIHLYWAGKGTIAIPSRGSYGPLISAITVTPNFKPDLGDDGLSVGAIIGIVIGSLVVVAFIVILLWMKGCFGGKDLRDKEFQGLELQTGYFSLKQIKAATKNFDPENKIGEGGFGPVYKGILPDGSVIAVKQLSSKSKQGNREFVNEIGMISALQHPNLVKLFGCCIEGNQLLLIYEYMENNSLARALFGREEHRLRLDWPTRRTICLGIARGLTYLHEESRLKIVHRDIKATNVLLDKNLNAKISDFGLAKLDEGEDTHISTRIAGTIGYMAPEYAMRGYLTDKADVYSYGVVLLEIVSGKSNTNYRPKEEFVYLLDWAYVLQEKGDLLELVDPSLGSDYKKEEAQRMLKLALLCTSPSPTLRPNMSTVVSMLEGQVTVSTALRNPGSSNEDMRFKAFEKLSHDSQIQGTSTDGPWSGSSMSMSLQSYKTEDTTEKTSANRLLPNNNIIDLE